MLDIHPLAKQLFVASATWLAAASAGGALSFPTVLLHQLSKNDSSIQLDFDTASWIGSVHGLAGIPTVILPIIMHWRGRKICFILSCLPAIIGWILMYFAQNATTLIVAEVMLGFSTNSILAVSSQSMTEMIPPSHRHVCVMLYGVVHWIAMAINTLLMQHLHWKTISLIMGVPMVLAVVIGFMWPESPYWLAVTHEFERCEKSFIWLRGTDKSSMKELGELIERQKEIMAAKKSEHQFYFKLSSVTRKDFILPMFYMLVFSCLTYWSGSLVVLIYSEDIIQRTTRRDDITRYGGFIFNILMSVGIFVCLGLSRWFSKKIIMLTCIGCAVVCLLGISIVSYLQSVSILPEKSLLCFYLLTGFIISTGTGICLVAYVLATELIPVKHRGLGGALMEICYCLSHASALKFAPYLMLYINLSGTFLLYAIITLVCGLIIWKYVPDTTGRTLQEIEDYHNYGKFNNRQEETANIELINCK